MAERNGPDSAALRTSQLLDSQENSLLFESGRADEPADVPGVPDHFFDRPQSAEIMTRQEVRSVVLSKLSGPVQVGDVMWDIGVAWEQFPLRWRSYAPS